MPTQPIIDEAKQRAFVRKALGDISSTTAVVMAMVGEGLGHHPPKAKGLCSKAELSSVNLLSLEYPFHNIYEIKP